MHNKIIIVLAFLSVAKSHDVIVGLNTEGRKIFDEKREANPAIWRQVQNVTVNTTDNEVISRIVVTDLRPEKDGDVNIIDGGEGQKSVTLELKSPTVLRGYEFHIEVYAVPDKNQQAGSQKNVPETSAPPSQVRKERHSEETKNTDISSNNPPQINTDVTIKSPEHIKNEHQKIPTPISVLKDSKVDSSRQTRQTESQTQFNPPPPPAPHFHFQETPEGENIPKIPFNGNPVPPFNPSSGGNTATANSTVSSSNQQSKYTRDTKTQEEDKNTQPRALSNNKDQNAPIVPPVAAEKPANVYSDQTRSLRDVQNKEENDQTKPVQPALPEYIPKISLAGNAPEIIPPNGNDRSGDNNERRNSAVSTLNQQSKHTRDTKEQENNTQPLTLSNKDEKTPIVPPVIGNKPTDTNKDHTRRVRDVQSQEKTEDKLKPIVPPESFAKNFENSTNIPIISNEKRIARATEKEEKSDENVNPSLQNNRRPFVPANVAKSIGNATTIAVEDKRIARNTQNKDLDDSYKPRPHITGPIIPANFAKNLDNATRDAPNNEKRNARDTQDVSKSDINVSTEKTTDNKNPPSFATRNFGGNDEQSAYIPKQSQHKSTDNAHTGHIHTTNDGYPANSKTETEKQRVARDTQNVGVNKPKSTDNSEKKLNPPAVANRNAEKVQTPRPRPKSREIKKIPRVPNTAQTDKNNPSTPKGPTNAPRNVRSAQDVPKSPPALFSSPQPKNDENNKAFQFQIQGTDPLSSIFPVTQKTTTSTTTTATTKKSKRETDLNESYERNDNITKTPRISAQTPSTTSTPSKPFNQKPVISIQ